MMGLSWVQWLAVLCMTCLSSQTDLLNLLLKEIDTLSAQDLVTVRGFVISEDSGVGEHVMIGAFNVRVFGSTKASNPEVMDILVKIIKRYDLVLVQEVREESGQAIGHLMSLLNSDGVVYEMSLSERLGRSYSKEQYAYIYKFASVQMMTAEVYPDQHDTFEREPYVGLFKYRDGQFGVIGIHTRPDAADLEIDALVDVYDYYSQKWNMKDFMLMGDFNADCSYVTSSEWSSIRLWSDDRFVWLVDNDLDTTTTTTHCAYDRIIIAGNLLREMVDPGSVEAFKFDKVYGLTKKEAFDVSDHYPVECKLYLKAGEQSLKALEKIHFSQSVSVQNQQGPRFCPLRQVQVLFETCASKTGYTAVLDEYNKNKEMYFSVSDIPESHLEDIFSVLDCVASGEVCADLLSEVSRDLLRINLNAGAFPQPQVLPEVKLSTGAFQLQVQFKMNQSHMPYDIILTRKTEYQEEDLRN